MRLILVCLLVCGLLVAGCGGDDSSSSSSPSAAETPSGPPKLDSGKTYVAKVSTTKGDFEITLDSKQAPVTGGSFKSLADKGFYDKLTFHRIVPGFVIQGGDPNGDGTGGPGYSVVEAPPAGLKYTKGVVAMAKTQSEAPGTSGSQFFVVTAQDAQLPPDYALLGKVTSGGSVVDKISRVKTDPNTEAPLKKVTINSIKVSEQ
jgi:peptidyl-prolyl cis-trans isomerase B (cyclophilin B)